LQQKVDAVTSLLNTLIDEKNLSKVRRQREQEDALYNINLNLAKIDNTQKAIESFQKSQEMNRKTIWNDPVRLRAELSNSRDGGLGNAKSNREKPMI